MPQTRLRPGRGVDSKPPTPDSRRRPRYSDSPRLPPSFSPHTTPPPDTRTFTGRRSTLRHRAPGIPACNRACNCSVLRGSLEEPPHLSVIPAKAGIQGRGIPLTGSEHLLELGNLDTTARMCYRVVARRDQQERRPMFVQPLTVPFHGEPVSHFVLPPPASDRESGTPDVSLPGQVSHLPDTNGADGTVLSEKNRSRPHPNPPKGAPARLPSSNGRDASASATAGRDAFDAIGPGYVAPAG